MASYNSTEQPRRQKLSDAERRTLQWLRMRKREASKRRDPETRRAVEEALNRLLKELDLQKEETSESAAT